MVLFLKIVGGILALAIGVYLGWSGQFRQTPEELDKALGMSGRTRKVKRQFTPLDWLRKDQRGSHRRRRSHQPFKTAVPRTPDDSKKTG
ncbi:hypothetical protein ACFL3S_07565 [Gemmatimonadota bacterium]